MLKNNNFRKMLILTNCMTEFREYAEFNLQMQQNSD